MKKLPFIVLLALLPFCSRAQDTLRYNYAILNVDRPDGRAMLEYNNGFEENLWKKLHLSMRLTRHEILFTCFKYLNDNRYTLVSGGFYTGNMVPDGTVEYIFERQQR